MAGMEPYLTVKEVALMVKLSVVTIRRYTMRNEIPFHKIYRAVRYKKSEIEEWVETREVKTEGNEKERQQKTEGDLFNANEICDANNVCDVNKVSEGTGGNA